MHQKNNQAAQPSSATLHHDGDEDDDNALDPFRDGDDDIDEDDELDVDVVQDGGRGAWWRGMIARSDNAEAGDGDSEEDDDEFGDFAMAEDDKGGESPNKDQLVLRPLAVNPVKESGRGLSGLWPFGNNKSRREEESQDVEGDVVSADGNKAEESNNAVEVKEAARRTSIEDPDDEEVVVGK
jgi:hypothetical protein